MGQAPDGQRSDDTRPLWPPDLRPRGRRGGGGEGPQGDPGPARRGAGPGLMPVVPAREPIARRRVI